MNCIKDYFVYFVSERFLAICYSWLELLGINHKEQPNTVFLQNFFKQGQETDAKHFI
jgi:hypothetical protein